MRANVRMFLEHYKKIHFLAQKNRIFELVYENKAEFFDYSIVLITNANNLPISNLLSLI